MSVWWFYFFAFRFLPRGKWEYNNKTLNHTIWCNRALHVIWTSPHDTKYFFVNDCFYYYYLLLRKKKSYSLLFRNFVTVRMNGKGITVCARVLNKNICIYLHIFNCIINNLLSHESYYSKCVRNICGQENKSSRHTRT